MPRVPFWGRATAPQTLAIFPTLEPRLRLCQWILVLQFMVLFIQ